MKTTHVAGIDDAPFEHAHRGDVLIVGTVFSGARLEGVLSSRVRRDGINATARIASMVGESRFFPQLDAIMIQGIALAGFNVVDIGQLNRELDRPVLVVSRKQPDLEAIREALHNRVPGGRRKWRLIERAGPMEAVKNLWVQRAGLSIEKARDLIGEHARNGHLPEPLRTAHLIAGGVVTGQSGHRP